MDKNIQTNSNNNLILTNNSNDTKDTKTQFTFIINDKLEKYKMSSQLSNAKDI